MNVNEIILQLIYQQYKKTESDDTIIAKSNGLLDFYRLHLGNQSNEEVLKSALWDMFKQDPNFTGNYVAPTPAKELGWLNFSVESYWHIRFPVVICTPEQNLIAGIKYAAAWWESRHPEADLLFKDVVYRKNQRVYVNRATRTKAVLKVYPDGDALASQFEQKAGEVLFAEAVPPDPRERWD